MSEMSKDFWNKLRPKLETAYENIREFIEQYPYETIIICSWFFFFFYLFFFWEVTKFGIQSIIVILFSLILLRDFYYAIYLYRNRYQ